jgi:hypothetical protein
LAFVDFAPPIAAGIIGAATAIVAGQTANKNAERREAQNREADEHRERLRDLRMVTDDANLALCDLWSILGAFAYAIPVGNPPVSRRSPTEARHPDSAEFVDAYERLSEAHIRLLNRVDATRSKSPSVARLATHRQLSTPLCMRIRSSRASPSRATPS